METSIEQITSASEAGLLLKNKSAELAEHIVNGNETDSFNHLLNYYRIKGNTYNLDDHFMFDPMFQTMVPRRSIYKCARQLGKSQNLAASEVLRSSITPHFRTLFVCPRFEQIKRLSTLYIASFINDARIKTVLQDSTCDQSVLQRTFSNGAVQYFSFAFLDAERIRSISADEVVYDEVQDLNFDFLPVIEQVMGGSKYWRIQRYTGTPKSLDNTSEHLWLDSSQGIWTIQCQGTGCKHYNIACLENDLMDMIGKTTTICVKCAKPINPRQGFYLHRFPDRHVTFSGYHMSQPIHPFYFEIEENWKEMLVQKRTYPTSKFNNECLGEAYDSADRLVTSKQVKDISVSGRRNTLEHAMRNRQDYSLVSMGIDWGGGGDDSPSFTVMTIVGHSKENDNLDVLYADQLDKSLTPGEECKYIFEYYKKFKPNFIAHDFTGAGNVRESFMIELLGVNKTAFMPFSYAYAPNKKVISYTAPASGGRSSYTIDKARSLVVLCAMIRAGKITFPRYEDFERFSKHLLTLLEERTTRPRGSDMVLVIPAAGTCDDFAHALNMACSGIWYSQQRYPSIADAHDIELTMEDLKAMNPTEEEISKESLWDVKPEDKG